ncbi:MAG: SDR family NAD(P)-dependent oxidoreductase [Bacteroidales bacterium]|nr:SDR family NAD(P)-dependent oxidoreductase [Bacteroidales bacterium]
MERKVCLITGANSGIGKEAAILIAQRDYKVIIACRNPEKGRKALADIAQYSSIDSIDLKIVDMSLQSSIQKLSKSLHEEYSKIDVIIHNAAIFDITQKKPIISNEGVETIWATNHIGPVLLDRLIIDLLKKSPNGRIITISSKGLLAKPFLKINFNDPELLNERFDVVKAYYQSKLAQIMYTLWLSKELINTNITANSIRVPAVRIDVSKYPKLPDFLKSIYKFKSRFSLSPSKMAETYDYLSTSAEVKDISGKYFNEKNQKVKFGKYQKNWNNIEKLMNLTSKYIK